MEQLALLGRQSTTAKVGNEVREKRSVSDLTHCQGGKEQRTTGQRRRTESYGNAIYNVSKHKRGYRKRMRKI